MYPGMKILSWGQIGGREINLHWGIWALSESPKVVSKIAPTQVLGSLVASAKSSDDIGHVRPPKFRVTYVQPNQSTCTPKETIEMKLYYLDFLGTR